jgi:hypothetical protein
MLDGDEDAENFDLEDYMNGMDATFDGDYEDLNLPEDVLKKLAEQEAAKQAEQEQQGE